MPVGKIHISKKGNPEPCNATIRCPLGGESGEDEHFNTVAEAEHYLRDKNETKYGVVSTMSKKAVKAEPPKLPRNGFAAVFNPDNGVVRLNADERLIFDYERLDRELTKTKENIVNAEREYSAIERKGFLAKLTEGPGVKRKIRQEERYLDEKLQERDQLMKRYEAAYTSGGRGSEYSFDYPTRTVTYKASPELSEKLTDLSKSFEEFSEVEDKFYKAGMTGSEEKFEMGSSDLAWRSKNLTAHLNAALDPDKVIENAWRQE